jgi:hypothetical protein
MSIAFKRVSRKKKGMLLPRRIYVMSTMGTRTLQEHEPCSSLPTSPTSSANSKANMASTSTFVVIFAVVGGRVYYFFATAPDTRYDAVQSRSLGYHASTPNTVALALLKKLSRFVGHAIRAPLGSLLPSLSRAY